MEKEKQIEEMAKALTKYEKNLCDRLPKDKCLLTSAIHAQVSCDYCKIAEFLINAGYRKASEVAEEIFAEIYEARERWEAIYSRDYFGYGGDAYGYLESDVDHTIYELKRKFTEEKEDGKA